MYKITEAFKYWSQLLLLPLYWLSFLIPRNKRIWLFGSTFGRRFADNPKYLYLYMSQHRDKLKIRPVWISHDKKIVKFLNKNGYEAYYYHSLKGIILALRGRVYLFDNYSKDINFWQSGGALKVNMWHGIPLKKIQADNVFDKFRHPRNKWEKFKNFPRNLSDEKPNHCVLATSQFLLPIFASAFNTDNVLISGYPRNDVLIADKKKYKNIKNLLTVSEKKTIHKIKQFLNFEYVSRNNNSNNNGGSSNKMALYMPTFRESELKFFNIVDIDKFQQFLEDKHILFCVKLHPKSKLRERFVAINADNILIIDADDDPYVFLELSDMLVTDYSSIYFDYLLLDKPIIFFNYDLEEYLNNSREMYFDYDEFTPGEKVQDQIGLERAMSDVVSSNEVYDDSYKLFRDKISDKVFDSKDRMGCPIFINKIIHLLNKTIYGSSI